MKTIVSIISEQTIPNYIFIKEMYKQGDELMFISSEKMKNRIEWITGTLNYTECKITSVVFKQENDEEKWNNMKKIIIPNLCKEVKYFVNLTGGTKYMALAVQSVFEKFDCDFFYIPFPKNYILKMSGNVEPMPITYRVCIEEYMSLYNLKINQKDITQTEEYTNRFFDMFINGCFSKNELEIINKLRSYRDGKRSKKIISINDIETLEEKPNGKYPRIEGLGDFLSSIQFPNTDGILSSEEVQYITGGWFEEYVYHIINNIGPNDIKIGVLIMKTMTSNMNDLDVVFTLGNKLHVIECKTGIGKENPFSEIVYKASSLKEYLFGLSAKSYICSLNPENVDSNIVAKNMGMMYCDKTYFVDKQKQLEWLNKIRKDSYDEYAH